MSLILSATAAALPAQVLILRHAEKPEQGNGLSAKGFARARALPVFFTSNPAATQFGPAVAIFVAAPNGDSSASIRPWQTMVPTARAFHLDIDSRFSKDQYQQVAYQILFNPQFNNRMVIVCWVHDQIPALAAALGIKPMPPPWNDQVFDRVWQINYRGGAVGSFRDFPQRLLPGDTLR